MKNDINLPFLVDDDEAHRLILIQFIVMMKSSVARSSASQYKDNELVINYHDAVIYGSDLKLLLHRTEWLNDTCIHFFFTFLEQRQPNSKTKRYRTYFMDPSVISFFMHQCVDDDDIDDFLQMFHETHEDGNNDDDGNKKSSRNRRMFIPVNDNMANDANWQIPSSGNHWSLLVITWSYGDENNTTSTSTSKSSSSVPNFWHFDSMSRSGNHRAASHIMEKFNKYLFSKSKSSLPYSSNHNDDNNVPAPPVPTLIEASCPKQWNGYDCGVHVLVAVKLFSEIVDDEEVDASDDEGDDNDKNNNRKKNDTKKNHHHHSHPFLCLDRYESTLQNYMTNDNTNPSDVCTKLRQEIATTILSLAE